MLLLTRRVDEEIVVGGNIRIRVVSISKGQVRLGFEAPKEIPILRPDAVHRSPVKRNPPA